MMNNYDFNPYLVSCYKSTIKNQPTPGISKGARIVRWYELLYVTESNDGATRVDDLLIPNPAGSLMFRRPGMSIENFTAYTSYNIALDPAYDSSLEDIYRQGHFELPPYTLTRTLLDKNCPMLNQIPLILDINIDRQPIFEKLFQEAHQLHLLNPSDYHLKNRRILFDIFDLIIQEIHVQKVALDPKQSATHERLEQARSHIHQNYQQTIALVDLAKVSGYSKEAFARLFKKHYHQSPINYLIELRLVKAKELLLATDLTLEHISAQSGFGSHIHFCNTFKSRVGVSPGRYRRTHTA